MCPQLFPSLLKLRHETCWIDDVDSSARLRMSPRLSIFLIFTSCDQRQDPFRRYVTQLFSLIAVENNYVHQKSCNKATWFLIQENK